MNIPKKIIFRKQVGTDFLKKNYYKKLILKEEFNFMSEIFKIKPVKLKDILLSNNDKYFSRELFSFLSAEALFRMYINNENPENLFQRYFKYIND